MQQIAIKFDFARFTIAHFLDFQSGNLERITMAAHSLAEGGILHYPPSMLKPILDECNRQYQEYTLANQGRLSKEQIQALWDQALRGPMNGK